jgi:hypothetical protein
MSQNGLHASDLELQMFEDHELNENVAARIQRHIEICAGCQLRHHQMRRTKLEFNAAHRAQLHQVADSASSSRAALQARMAASGLPAASAAWKYPLYAGCAGLAFLVILAFLFRSAPNDTVRLLPNPKITPGATLNVTKGQVCGSLDSPATGQVPAATGETIFEEYGIRDPRNGGYELDHLIDLKLGGSDDPRNLWPQPYSAVWNARVKDALEEHLHDLVCSGQISLTTAQQDVSINWIAAYRKYFHTDKPIVAHMAFSKDKPWTD